MDCKSAGVSSEYFGETSRSLWDRYSEYKQSLASRSGNSCVLKHWNEHHQDQEDPPPFNYRVIIKCKTATQRQLIEALRIESFNGDIAMNSKGEWGRNFVPRRVVFHQDEVWEPETAPDQPVLIKRKNREQEVSGDNFVSQLSQRRKRYRIEKVAQSIRLDANVLYDGSVPQPIGRNVYPQLARYRTDFGATNV